MNRQVSYHQVVLTLLMLLSGVSVSGTDNDEADGYIYLSLQDTGGGPLTTFPVFLTDTLGTMWDLIQGERGEYGLSVPEGYYFLTARCLMYETYRTAWMYLYRGDSITLEHRFEWLDLGDDTWQEFRPDTLQALRIYLKAEGNGNLDGLTVFSPHRFYRETRISDDCYMVYVDNTCFSLKWNLPSLGDRSFSLPFNDIFGNDEPSLVLRVEDPALSDLPASDWTDKSLLTLANTTDDEWVAPDYEVRRELINPADWGHEELDRYGYVDGRAYFDLCETEARWRIVLAFHRRVVVLTEDGDPIVHDLDSSISRAVFSPRGRYLFFFDASRGMHCREEGILLNTDTGEERRFVPDPYAEPYEWNPTFSSPPISTAPYWTYHPADDGSVIALFCDSVRLYNEQLGVLRTSYLEGTFLGDGHNNGIRQRSSDGDRIAVIDYGGDECRLVLFSRSGSMEFTVPVSQGMSRADDSLTVLTAAGYLNGISVLDLSDGSLLWHFDAEQCGQNVVSPSGNLISWNTGRGTCEIRSRTGELIDSFPSGEPRDNVCIGYLGDDGTSVVLLHGNRVHRFALRSESGEPVWLSASRHGFPRTDASYSSLSSILDLLALSPDGKTLVYNDGSFIHILTFTRITEH